MSLKNNNFDFIEQYKFSDKCPDYKTKEQFEIFIKCREIDIDNINKAIKEAKSRLREYK